MQTNQSTNPTNAETWYGYPESAQVFSPDCPTVLPDVLTHPDVKWVLVGPCTYVQQASIYQAKVAEYMYTILAVNSQMGKSYTVYRENLKQFEW